MRVKVGTVLQFIIIPVLLLFCGTSIAEAMCSPGPAIGIGESSLNFLWSIWPVGILLLSAYFGSRGVPRAVLKRGIPTLSALVLGLLMYRLYEMHSDPFRLALRSCRDQGGVMIATSCSDSECAERAPDAGKPCQDSSECLGVCLPITSVRLSQPLLFPIPDDFPSPGICSTWKDKKNFPVSDEYQSCGVNVGCWLECEDIVEDGKEICRWFAKRA